MPADKVVPLLKAGILAHTVILLIQETETWKKLSVRACLPVHR